MSWLRTLSRNGENLSAIISDCGQYRYTLHRTLESPLRWVKPCLFIMLNPSTADAELDDPTIRRCISFAKREGCTELTVVNLFALRSTNPEYLLTAQDPVGPDNDQYIKEQVEKHQNGLIIAAWGSHKSISKRVSQVIPLLNNAYCLGTNKDGTPKHPLYLASLTPLIRYAEQHEYEVFSNFEESLKKNPPKHCLNCKAKWNKYAECNCN